ncbi:thioredoxin domain-containing protein [Gordonia sp. w5E2]|uniref:Membrane protein n=1 Tax=Gordonia jacobaea TaxID=122202 RepID=A0ABR5IAN6_9ACTN|nr:MULTISPECIES: thioredoxin domain-containing protein [Gordonia]KNA90736.1 membrane protein [Gordonia jacobaea]SKZ19428.1 thioredoxin domain-containing protein [Mycobacteroides abscessus subsp. abscessus]
MPNQLSESSSPYLRQHADNPVDWREWSDAALEESVRRDVPVLLSVGYAACHWCHVMAHESFEDAATAAQMNRDFVCIKVDREERPDIDAIYMNATVAMTRQGGWPMTCFLTPSGEPFYCGTYFPDTPRGGMPSFRQILSAVTQAWTTRRSEIESMGSRVREALSDAASALPAGGVDVDERLLDYAVTTVLGDEDRVSGGFGGAPKFPPSALLEGLLRHYERSADAAPLQAVMRTTDAMARGGIYDQLGGGFSRYAVDNDWVVPHFEKMLYDNAQLLRVYGHLARIVDDPLPGRIAEEIVDFLRRDLRVVGGFASSLDADAAGVEGSTYVWTPAELREVLGDEDGEWAAALFGVTEAGTFEHGASTLQLRTDPEDADRYADLRRRLLTARASRPQPPRDDKVVTGWNAMAVTALAEAGAALDHPDWVELAVEVLTELVDTHLVDGQLRRSSLGGIVGVPVAALDDHAALVTAMLTVCQVTGEKSWCDKGLALLDSTIETFADPDEAGAWFDAAQGTLIARPRDPADGATPSGASLVAEAALIASALARMGPATRYASIVDETLTRGSVLLAKVPRSAGHWLAVAEARQDGPIQVAIAEDSRSAGELATAARRLAPGGAIVVSGARDSQPLLDGRGPVKGHDAAYVCRGTVCDLPVVDAHDLAASLARSAAT